MSINNTTLESITDLRMYNINNSMSLLSAELLGYYQSGDGGGSEFYWESSPAAVINNLSGYSPNSPIDMIVDPVLSEIPIGSILTFENGAYFELAETAMKEATSIKGFLNFSEVIDNESSLDITKIPLAEIDNLEGYMISAQTSMSVQPIPKALAIDEVIHFKNNGKFTLSASANKGDTVIHGKLENQNVSDGEKTINYASFSTVTINDTSINTPFEITVDPISETIPTGTELEFTGGGTFILTRTANKGNTSLIGNLSNASISDGESSFIKDNGGTIIKPTYIGYNNVGRWKKTDPYFINSRQFGIKTDGTEVSSQIESALNALPDGCFFKFVPGTYKVEGEITVIDKSGLFLDCNGCKFDATGWLDPGLPKHIFNIDGSINQAKKITGISKTSITTDTFVNPPEIGEWVLVSTDELIDDSYLKTRPYYLKNYLVQVESVAGDVITLNPHTPLFYEYDLTSHIKLIRINFAKGNHILGLDLDLFDTDASERSQGGIEFKYSMNFSVKDCDIIGITREGVSTRHCLHGNINENYFKVADNRPDVANYGVYLHNTTRNVTINSNTIDGKNSIDGDCAYYIQITGNTCTGIIRNHGSLFWNIAGNTYGGDSLVIRSGHTRVTDNTIFSTNSDSRGIFLEELAKDFGNVSIVDNDIYDIHVYDSTEMNTYAIEVDAREIQSVKIKDNNIYNFRGGIYVTGQVSAESGRTNNDYTITGNVCRVYAIGIYVRNLDDALISMNKINLIDSSGLPGGGFNSVYAILLGGGSGDECNDVNVNNNHIKGSWTNGVTVAINDFKNFSLGVNHFSSDVTNDYVFPSGFLHTYTKYMATKNIKMPSNSEVYSWKINDSLAIGQKIVIGLNGTSDFDIEMIECTILGVVRGSGQTSNKVMIVKKFAVVCRESDLLLNSSSDIFVTGCVSSDLTLVHKGSSHEYDLQFLAPSTILQDLNELSVKIEFLSTRNDDKSEVLRSEPIIV